MVYRYRKKIDPDSESDAFKYASKLFKYRMRSEAEMKKRLLERGFSEECVQRVMEKLKEKGFVDDEKFSYLFAYDELTLRNHGPRIIKSKLKALGVNEEIIEKSLKKVLEEVDLEDVIKKLLKKASENPREYLFRRGFDPGILNEIDYGGE
ncbi:MAG: hypothetical protein DRP38_06245 [Thermotogae bacterium]|nr:RecX family transcriptional regulator [Thermotogaceae bacterium]OQX57126.1 MAG: hypothetical protein B5M49_04430 [Thermotoga sp. 4484_232]RKX47627.1 MAG: hypothetical protein DRP38_06245 [Thermotogota bacterium]RKX55130.1 MAG: hypothetical protein DRP24_05440 [Thermotoga sp.]HDG61990.1 hypothetical protein [Thermotoga sp.]